MSEAIASKAERLAAYNANIAAAEKDPSLSPETGKPLSKMNAARFGAGFLVFGVLWMSGLGIVSAVLLPMHYKTIPGVNADALVGIVNAFTAVASLVANLMFGNFSDRSRSRFGRRTPWILFGAVLGGVTLFLTGTTHNAVLLTIFYCACMFGLNCMIAPMVAILSDRVPSKIRGTMSAFYGAGSTIGAPIGTMLGALFIENLIPGFAVAGVLMCSAYPTLIPTTGSLPGIKAFTAAVIGGIGSIPGAFVGGLVLGVIEIFAKAYVGTQLADAIVFAVLIVVLLVKPSGLLGKTVREKV